MVRKSVVAVAAAMAVVLGAVVVSTSAGAVVDTATIVSSPNAGTANDRLSSVSCVSASDCIAVGSTDDGTEVIETLAMKWNGSEWQLMLSPNAGTSNDTLHSISCVSSSFCMAVGSTQNGSVRETLAMVWNGTTWSIVSSPSPSTSANDLLSVSCVSASYCVAVGDRISSVYKTLALVWNGSGWSDTASPSVGTVYDYLTSVSCVSVSYCVAVGGTYLSGYRNNSLAMVWDGATWSIATSPNNSNRYVNVMRSVSCVSASDCVAVGNTAMAWDGATWSAVSVPTYNANNEFRIALTSVSCQSTSECVAVGVENAGINHNQTSVMVRDGNAWSVVTSPSAGTSDDQLLSLSCVSADDCVGVGYSKNGNSVYETMIVSLTLYVPPTTTTTTTEPPTTTTTEAPTTTTTAPVSTTTSTVPGSTTSTTAPVSTTTSTVIPTTTTTSAPGSTTSSTVRSSTTTSTVAPTTSTTLVVSEAQVRQLPVAVLAPNLKKIARGQWVRLSGGGFGPRKSVNLYVASDPIYLGSGVADENGVVTVEGVIPDGLDAGEHSLALIDPETGVGFRQDVSLDAADASSGLPTTGTDSTPMMALGALFVLGGAGLAVVAKRRRFI